MTTSLFSDPKDLNAYGRGMAQLLLLGGFELERLAKGGPARVAFRVWSDAVCKAGAPAGIVPTGEQLSWLWEALITEPRIREELGTRLLLREDEWKQQFPVPVFSDGTVLGVFLKPFSTRDMRTSCVAPEIPPAATITLRNTLRMAPGKAASRRFECEDVDALVAIRVANPGPPAQEAILLKLEPEDVVVNKDSVTAPVRSLNHAYTVTSRRLQPHRRGHGGRAYDHIAWLDDGRWVSLEAIRRKVEQGNWKIGHGRSMAQ